MINEIIEAIETKFENNEEIKVDCMKWLYWQLCNIPEKNSSLDRALIILYQWFEKHRKCIYCGKSLISTYVKTDKGNEIIDFCPFCDTAFGEAHG